ncbi:MAG TPA: hypothetical protein VMF56_05280 [Acidobacteriaceae bacterium]|nr:hypothetical protein [Acidobacteriaceae bacterium]
MTNAIESLNMSLRKACLQHRFKPRRGHHYPADLAQIIVKEAKTPQSSFPLDLLRQMVVASGRATQESALN